MPGQTRHNTRPQNAQFPPSFLDMDACTTSQLNVALVRKLLCACLIFDTLSISVCTTRHWQTSGQLMQELTVCTVYNSLDQMDNNVASRVANDTQNYFHIIMGKHPMYATFQSMVDIWLLTGECISKIYRRAIKGRV